jgi:hypothetical protein
MPPTKTKKPPVIKKGKQSKTVKDNNKAPKKTRAKTTRSAKLAVITPTKTLINDNPYGKIYTLVFSTGKYTEYKSWKEAEDIKEALPIEAKTIGICVVDGSEDKDFQIKKFIKEKTDMSIKTKVATVLKTKSSKESAAVKNNNSNDPDDGDFSMLKTSRNTVTENETAVVMKSERSEFYKTIAVTGNEFIIQIFEVDPDMFPGTTPRYYPFTLDFRSNRTTKQPYWVHKAEYIVQAIQFEHNHIPKEQQKYKDFHANFKKVTLRKEPLGVNERKTFTLKTSNIEIDYDVIVGYAPVQWRQPRLEQAILKFKSTMTCHESRTLYHEICQKNSRGAVFVQNTEPSAEYWSKLEESPNKIFRETSLDSTFMDEDIKNIISDCFGVNEKEHWSKEIQEYAYGSVIVTS